MHGIIHWAARLWSIPALCLGFVIAIGPLAFATNRWNGLAFLNSISGIIFVAALVVAWRHELGGGLVALFALLVWTIWITLLANLPFATESFLVWPPAILFVLAAFFDAVEPAPTTLTTAETESAKTTKTCGVLTVPHTKLGWYALGLTACSLVFMRLFWMQAGIPRDRSTFFSDPVNAICLIGIFACPLVGSVLAFIDILRKRERSWTLIPVIVLGPVALLWILAALFGNP